MSAEPPEAAPVCRWCGVPLPVRTGRGRPGRYCGTTCRVNAHRASRRAETGPAVRTTANALARELAAAGRELAAAAIGRAPDPVAEVGARRLVDELAALARQAAVAAPPVARNETSAPATQSGGGQTADTKAPPPSGRNEKNVRETKSGGVQAAGRAKRPPKGLLSEPLWRVMADLHAAGPDGLSYGRHRGGWHWLAENRRTAKDGPYVSDRAPDGRREDGRRWLTDAGRAHIAAHADRYRQLYPHVELRTAQESAARPLTDPDLWRVLVDIATGVLTDPAAQIPGRYSGGGWGGLNGKYRRVDGAMDRLRDLGLVTITGDGHRRVTDAGHAHITDHHPGYARQWPDIPTPWTHPPTPARNENPETVTETGQTGADQDLDRDELFDALEDLVGLDRTGLPAELAEALTLPIVALASALAGASGDGPVDELVAAGRDVVDAVVDYRQMPAAAGLVRLVDRLAAALPPATATGRDENPAREEKAAGAAPAEPAPAEPAPPADDDTAAYDREQAEERRRFEASLKPVPGMDGVVMAEWPGTGCYYLVEAATGERIGYAEKKAYSSVWEARTMRGSKVPATTTYKTRREALVQVALHHQETTQQTRRTGQTGRSGRRRVGRPGEHTGENYDLVRSPDYDTTGAWQVLAAGARVGQVRPLHRPTGGKAWTAHGPSGVAITIGAGKDGGYRTRNAAAVQVLITHRINARSSNPQQAKRRNR